MKKRALTLIEIMIVIFLITLITGAIGYNMKGSMDKGRKFRTEQAISQVHDLLLLCLEDNQQVDAATVASNAQFYISRSGLAKDPVKLLKDGWGEALEIKAVGKSDFKITSKNMK